MRDPVEATQDCNSCPVVAKAVEPILEDITPADQRMPKLDRVHTIFA